MVPRPFFPLQVTLFHWFTILFFIHKSAIPFTIEPIFTPLLGLLLHTTLLFQCFLCTPSVLNKLSFELWNQMPHALLHQHYHTVFSFNPTTTTSQTKHIQNSTFFPYHIAILEHHTPVKNHNLPISLGQNTSWIFAI